MMPNRMYEMKVGLKEMDINPGEEVLIAWSKPFTRRLFEYLQGQGSYYFSEIKINQNQFSLKLRNQNQSKSWFWSSGCQIKSSHTTPVQGDLILQDKMFTTAYKNEYASTYVKTARWLRRDTRQIFGNAAMGYIGKNIRDNLIDMGEFNLSHRWAEKWWRVSCTFDLFKGTQVIILCFLF